MTLPNPPAPDPRDARIAELEARLAAQDRVIAELRAQLAALQGALAAAQRAAKRQATPFARAERKADPQRPGRKKGQGPFRSRAKPAPDQITETKQQPLVACPHCGGPVADCQPQEQFQIEIPPAAPVVTRFLTVRGTCAQCTRRVQSVHPEQISTATGAAGVVLGPRLKAFAADLHHRLGLSYGKIAALLRDLYGLPITRGGLCQAGQRLARRARPIYDDLIALLRQSAAVHVDETGWRLGVLAAWLWVFTNQQITVYTIATSRGHEVVLNILGQDFAGVLIADRFSAYDAAALQDWLHQKCLAHLLRNLRDLREQQTGRARQFADDVMAVARDALRLKAGAADLRAPVYEAAAAGLEERLDRLLDPGRRLRDAANVQMRERLRRHRDDLLRFLYWEEVDGTNNEAERALRPGVITRKTGGCNRTETGAETHAVLASVLATCQRQAVPILDYLVKLQQFGATPPSLVPA